MAHESFENAEVAALMNAYFINIKVDREERPDLDEIYMRATVIYTRGHGGWPMSVFLTPDLKPFFAGTYFPPDDRYGRPGFGRLCETIHHAWTERRDELLQTSATLSTLISESLATAPGDAAITLAQVDQTADALAQAFDPIDGGLLSGPTNKFAAQHGDGVDAAVGGAAARRPGRARQTDRRGHEHARPHGRRRHS